MPDLLSAAQLASFRKTFFPDEVDLHEEWGTAPAASASGSIGASTLAVDGLQSGTGLVLTKGTRFRISSAGLWRTYALVSDVAVSTDTGTATLSFSPVLNVTVADNDRIVPIPELRSDYNRKTGKQYLSDDDVQALATRAVQWKGLEISESDDPATAILQATAVLAIKQAIADTGFRSVIYSGDSTNSTTAGDAVMKSMLEQAQRWEGLLSPRQTGAHSLVLFR